MKRKLIFCGLSFVLALTLLLSGCDMHIGNYPTEHTFIQDRSNVKKVEICTHDYTSAPVGPITPIVVLSEEEIDSLWIDLLNLEVAPIIPEHTVGDILFVISYQDGQQELLGFSEAAFLKADGKFGLWRGYVFYDGRDLADVFAKYADPDMLSEISEYFSFYYRPKAGPKLPSLT